MAGTNGLLQKVYVGLAIVLLGAVLLAWVTTAGDVRVNATVLKDVRRRADQTELIIRHQSDSLTAIKGDVREIKAILERMEKR